MLPHDRSAAGAEFRAAERIRVKHMMSTVRIATIEDVRHLPEIERSAGRAFLSIQELAWIAANDVTSQDVDAARVAQGTTWVVEIESKVVGFLSAEIVEEELHVWELAVHFDWQGKGLGRSLMSKAISHAKYAGLWSVTLTTFKDVPWNEPFYRSLGFESATFDMPARLRNVLLAEAESGLLPESRCAMILSLSTGASV
jgi:GNAT superfamily N-acetyltransferase